MELPPAEAAVVLGLSTDAVRMRVKRRTLPSTRRDGRLFVILPDEAAAMPALAPDPPPVNTDPTTDPTRPNAT